MAKWRLQTLKHQRGRNRAHTQNGSLVSEHVWLNIFVPEFNLSPCTVSHFSKRTFLSQSKCRTKNLDFWSTVPLKNGPSSYFSVARELSRIQDADGDDPLCFTRWWARCRIKAHCHVWWYQIWEEWALSHFGRNSPYQRSDPWFVVDISSNVTCRTWCESMKFGIWPNNRHLYAIVRKVIVLLYLTNYIINGI